MTMFRINGCSVFEGPAFYDACDRAGILIYHDFMLTDTTYPEEDKRPFRLIMLWLAILREAVTVQELSALLVNALPRAQLRRRFFATRSGSRTDYRRTTHRCGSDS